jgi:hypothetical protein
MKHLYKLVLSALLAVILTTGCDTTALHEMNIDPNAVNTIDLNYFLTGAELNLASGGGPQNGDNRYVDWRTNIGMCAHCTQQLATTNVGLLGGPGDKYIDNDPEVLNAPFQFWITEAGRNTYEILKQTGTGGYAEGKNLNLRQAARIIRAYNFMRLSDMYGSVPYSEANRGIEGLFFPKYDKQKDIYLDALKELDEAAQAISASNPDEGFANADFIYNGDISKWKKWAYSLMLRFAMRISNVDATDAVPYINKAISGGVFTSNDDNVWVAQSIGPSEWMNQNGISRAMMPGDGGAANESYMSETLINWLKGTDKNSVADDDPRLMIYSGGIADWTSAAFTPYPGGLDPLNQVGEPNGKDQAMLDVAAGHTVIRKETFSKMNPLLLQDDEFYRLMDYAEVEFLQAEAIERSLGTISGTAKEHYEKGVKAAMQMWTKYDPTLVVTDAQVATYLATYPYGVTKPALEMIGEQQWAGHFMNWFEAWSEWRRTGFPVLVPVNYPGNSTNGTIPVRLRLPASEVSGNPNYSTATMPDEMTTKVWWDGGAE